MDASNKDDGGVRDTSTLSGGERSFTTLALLLALGEAVECPFRGKLVYASLVPFSQELSFPCLLVLDEFDVFMDAANRKVVLKSVTTIL
jgi:chromosome segregation ATPase